MHKIQNTGEDLERQNLSFISSLAERRGGAATPNERLSGSFSQNKRTLSYHPAIVFLDTYANELQFTSVQNPTCDLLCIHSKNWKEGIFEK